jgi:BirA family biotin operon repressor/biotin-[acetyl-CoA-carboxylase] ligase
MQQAEDGAPDGSVYFADEQTQGRGRGAHAWTSPPGSGLYVSILLRPLHPARRHPLALARRRPRRAQCHPHRHFAPARSPLAQRPPLRPTQILRHPHRAQRGSHTASAMRSSASASMSTSRSSPKISAPSLLRSSLRPAATGLARTCSSPCCNRSTPNSPPSPHPLTSRPPRKASATVSNGAPPGFAASASESTKANGFTGITEGLDPRGFLLVRTPQGLRTVLSGGVRESGPP